MGFLARIVRAGGIAAGLRLPEPLTGAEPTALARSWLAAARAAQGGTTAELAFGRWLETVAALMALRRSAPTSPRVPSA